MLSLKGIKDGFEIAGWLGLVLFSSTIATGCLSVTAKAPDVDMPIFLGRVLVASSRGSTEVNSSRVGKFQWKIQRKESESECLLSRDSSVSSSDNSLSDNLSQVRNRPAAGPGTGVVYRVERLRVRARFGILPLIIYNNSTDLTRIDLEGSIRVIESGK